MYSTPNYLNFENKLPFLTTIFFNVLKLELKEWNIYSITKPIQLSKSIHAHRHNIDTLPITNKDILILVI